MSAVGWVLVRRIAKARPTPPGMMMLDGFAPFLWFAILLAASARPIFAGVVSLATFGGLAFCDYFKRATLREPVLFCDSVELLEIARHPELYLPFAGPKRVIAGVSLTFAAFAFLLVLEPPAWTWSWTEFLLTVVACAVSLWALMCPLQPWVTQALAPLPVSGDPAEDGERLGPLTTLLVYGVRARAERKARALLAVAQTGLAQTPGPARGHVVLVQSEAFVDARRLPGADPALTLPNLDAARAAGPRHGRLVTPAWGANTVRTEFEALTGVADQELGFDRFNPYYAFVQGALPSLAWSLKARGYRTICVHPYAGAFYRRKFVLPKLGFDAFFDIDAFKDAPTRRGFVTDAAVSAFVERLIAEAAQPLFIFVVTMENHGPWTPSPGEAGGEQAVYGRGVANADAMIGRLAAAVGADRGEGLLAFYGDHCPMLDNVGEDGRTDYVIWRGGGSPAVADIPAASLAQACLDALER